MVQRFTFRRIEANGKNVYGLYSILKILKQVKGVSYRKSKNKKWFDFDLIKIRRERLRKDALYSRYPNGPAIRGSFWNIENFTAAAIKRSAKNLKRL